MDKHGVHMHIEARRPEFGSIVGQRMVCWRKRAFTPNAMFVIKSNSGSKAGQEGTAIDKI